MPPRAKATPAPPKADGKAKAKAKADPTPPKAAAKSAAAKAVATPKAGEKKRPTAAEKASAAKKQKAWILELKGCHVGSILDFESAIEMLMHFAS